MGKQQSCIAHLVHHVSRSRAIECNPAHEDWNHAMPDKSMLKSWSGPFRLPAQQESGGRQTKTARMPPWLWYFLVLPIYYTVGALIRFLPAVLAFVILGGVCNMPPLSYPQCSLHWQQSPSRSFSAPWIEALAMTLLLCILSLNVWTHVKHIYYFYEHPFKSYDKESKRRGLRATSGCGKTWTSTVGSVSKVKCYANVTAINKSLTRTKTVAVQSLWRQQQLSRCCAQLFRTLSRQYGVKRLCIMSIKLWLHSTIRYHKSWLTG